MKWETVKTESVLEQESESHAGNYNLCIYCITGTWNDRTALCSWFPKQSEICQENDEYQCENRMLLYIMAGS